jgi:choline dehydrogenase-like flavoprotein
MRIAVIGSGPAAAATCLGLCDSDHYQKLDITVFDIGRKTGRFSSTLNKLKPKWDNSTYQQFHSAIRKAGKGWIPEKTHFGDFPIKYSDQAILKSDIYGGLSKFWGASFVPFTQTDLKDWPIDEDELSVYYRKMLNHIRITGTKDKLSSYLSDEWINEPPIRAPKPINLLKDVINSGANSSFIAGSPRLAMNNSGADGCTYCGHCFYGCYNQSIYSSDQTIDELINANKIRYIPNKQLISFKKKAEDVEIILQDTTNSTLETLHYDKVFIAAGCIETSRIVSASLGISQFNIVENPMFQVPIIYTGYVKSKEFNEYLALNNLLIGRLPGDGVDKYVHMQVYPLNVYLWNHALTKVVGNVGLKLSELAQRTVGKHVYMMLFYLHGDYTKGSTLSFTDDFNTLNFVNGNETNKQSSLVLKQLSHLLRGSGFHILSPLMSKFAPGGSYHYAGTLPMNDSRYYNNDSCAIDEDVYITDSSTFPSLPAQNHSFTIMANAYRIAKRSL